MRFFELKCKVLLKRDIYYRDTHEIISNFLSYLICQDEDYKEIHNSNEFKYYVFDSFYPIEKEGYYKKDRFYHFKIRSFDFDLMTFLDSRIRENINNPYMQVLEFSKRYQLDFFIKELYTVTPAIISTTNGRYWTFQESGDILQLQKQLHDNLEKKYKNFFGNIETENNFINLIEIKNRVPNTINYKNIKFFGNKFRIIPNEDEKSQKLAFVALGCGLGEKNAIGAGFCISKREK